MDIFFLIIFDYHNVRRNPIKSETIFYVKHFYSVLGITKSVFFGGGGGEMGGGGGKWGEGGGGMEEE